MKLSSVVRSLLQEETRRERTTLAQMVQHNKSTRHTHSNVFYSEHKVALSGSSLGRLSDSRRHCQLALIEHRSWLINLQLASSRYRDDEPSLVFLHLRQASTPAHCHAQGLLSFTIRSVLNESELAVLVDGLR